MSLNVSYNIKAIDKFSEVGRRIKDSLRGVSRGLRKMKDLGDKGTRTSRLFELQTRRTVRALRKLATTRIPNFGKKFTKGFRKIRRGLLSLKGALATVGISIGFLEIIKTGAKFEEQMFDLEAITGITGKQLQNLGDFSKEVAVKFGLVPSAVVEGIKLIVGANESLIRVKGGIADVTKEALILKTATGIELRDSVRVITTAMGQFNLGAKDSSRIINVLAAGSKIGASEVEDLIPSLQKVGAVAGSLGISIEEVTASLEVFGSAGLVKGARIGTGFQAVLLGIADKADMLKKELGISITKGNFIPGIKKLAKFFDKLKTVEEKTTLATELFGREGIKAGLILLRDIDIVAKWTKKITGTNVAVEQAAIRMKSFNFFLGVTKAKLSIKFIALFDRLRETLFEMTEEFGRFLDSIGPEELDKIAKSMINILKLAGALTIAFGKISKGLLLIIQGLEKISLKPLFREIIRITEPQIAPSQIAEGLEQIEAERIAFKLQRFQKTQALAGPPLIGQAFQGTLGKPAPSELIIEIKDKGGFVETVLERPKGLLKLEVGLNTVGL